VPSYQAILEEDDSVTLLAYPLAVGCASVSAVKQETEAVLQVSNCLTRSST
jgi:hypothetical protein